MTHRTYLVAISALLLASSTASATPTLKGEITVNKAIVTIGDMFDDAGASPRRASSWHRFRAPPASCRSPMCSAPPQRSVWSTSRMWALPGSGSSVPRPWSTPQPSMR